MPRLEEAQCALEAYETELRTKLNVPAGEHWNKYIPESGIGDRLFAKWQSLSRDARMAEEGTR